MKLIEMIAYGIWLLLLDLSFMSSSWARVFIPHLYVILILVMLVVVMVVINHKKGQIVSFMSIEV
jgi:hypothetical protein